MTLVVKEMAELTVPKGLLDKIDMPGLIKGFKSDYDKLDDLKAARNKHEQRGFISQWWNSDELEDAQLDAAELQASFSKKLGQLMVISIEQSKLLTQQQSHLTTQQNIIKEQATELASANKQLDKQQKKQMNQQQNLETLIEDYFELKGLTAKDAQKLILIANEVKEMKTAIYAKFDKELIAITLLKDNLLADLEKEIILFNSRLDKSEAKLLEQLKLVSNDLGKQFEETEKSLMRSINDTNTLIDEHFQVLTEVTNRTSSHLEALEKNSTKTQQSHEVKISKLQISLEETDSNLSTLQEIYQDKFKGLLAKTDLLSLNCEKQQADQQKINYSNSLKFEAELMRKNKQVKMLTIGLMVSFIIGTSSLGIILYPFLSQLIK